MHRSVRGLAASILLIAVLGACSDSAGSASPVPSPSAGVDPGPAVLIDDLLADPGAKDGQLVRVTGNFLADPTLARLCGLFMESYPPQCGGGSIRILGEVPADTLAILTTTTEPNLAKAWWGYVAVVGTFHAQGGDGTPTIELGEIELVEG